MKESLQERNIFITKLMRCAGFERYYDVGKACCKRGTPLSAVYAVMKKVAVKQPFYFIK
jgi:hypothetical protein